MWVSVDPGQLSLALKPDKGGKTSGARAAPVRKEARVSHGAQTATVDSLAKRVNGVAGASRDA